MPAWLSCDGDHRRASETAADPPAVEGEIRWAPETQPARNRDDPHHGQDRDQTVEMKGWGLGRHAPGVVPLRGERERKKRRLWRRKVNPPALFFTFSSLSISQRNVYSSRVKIYSPTHGRVTERINISIFTFLTAVKVWSWVNFSFYRPFFSPSHFLYFDFTWKSPRQVGGIKKHTIILSEFKFYCWHLNWTANFPIIKDIII